MPTADRLVSLVRRGRSHGVRPPPEAICDVPAGAMDGRTAVVTGATSGIGRETALALARLGAAHVAVHGRDREAGQAVVDRLRAAGATATFHPAEFADLDAVRDLADDLAAAVGAVDVLVNNAGAHFREGHLVDGVERTFVVNHLAPFVLTRALRPALVDGGRVVTVASRVHERADRGDCSRAAVTVVDGYDGLDAYGRSKLANVLFTRELARREPALVAACCHPGVVPGSGLWREASLPVSVAVRALAALPQALVGRFVDTAAEAAATPVHLAASPDPPTDGAYYGDCVEETPSAAARDDDLARELWALSESLVG